jgi:hypothetical protein
MTESVYYHPGVKEILNGLHIDTTTTILKGIRESMTVFKISNPK